MEFIKIAEKDYKNWKFDWSIPQSQGYDIYALRVKNWDNSNNNICHLYDNSLLHEQKFM